MAAVPPTWASTSLTGGITVSMSTPANWAISSGCSAVYLTAKDPKKCAHCEEDLHETLVGKRRFCTMECETAYRVAGRLGAEQYNHTEFGLGFSLASTMMSSGIVNYQVISSLCSTSLV